MFIAMFDVVVQEHHSWTSASKADENGNWKSLFTAKKQGYHQISTPSELCSILHKDNSKTHQQSTHCCHSNSKIKMKNYGAGKNQRFHHHTQQSNGIVKMERSAYKRHYNGEMGHQESIYQSFKTKDTCGTRDGTAASPLNYKEETLCNSTKNHREKVWQGWNWKPTNLAHHQLWNCAQLCKDGTWHTFYSSWTSACQTNWRIANGWISISFSHLLNVSRESEQTMVGYPLYFSAISCLVVVIGLSTFS